MCLFGRASRKRSGATNRLSDEDLCFLQQVQLSANNPPKALEKLFTSFGMKTVLALYI